MRKYGKWLLVLGVLAASPAWVNADGFLSGLRSTQTSKSTQKQVNQHKAEQVADALKQARLNGYDFEVEVRGDTVKLEGKVRDVTHRALASNVCRKVAGIQKIQNNLQYVPTGNIQRTGGFAQSGGLSNAAYTSENAGNGIQQVRYSKPGRRKSTASKTTSSQSSSQYSFQSRMPKQQAAAPAPKMTPPEISFASATPPAVPAPAPQAAPVVAKQAVETKTADKSVAPFIDLTAATATATATATAAPAPAGPTNQQVAEGIAQQLASVGLVGYDVTARYEDGVATLAGEVATLDQMKAAEYATSMLPSVKSVVNKLKVSGPIAQTAFAGQSGQVRPVGMSYPAQPMPQPMPGAHPGMHPGMHPGAHPGMMGAPMQPGPAGPGGPGPSPVGAAGNYSNPQLPSHAWPAYAQYPNSAAIQYPKQYSASAWPYIGPFYPYPQVPLGWREVSMEWDDGMWQLDFNQKKDAWYWLFAPRNW
ncbi:MAG: BON domain-containing protein [Fuerstiella sp.]